MSIRLLRDGSGREVYRVETPSGVIGYIATQVSDDALKKLIMKLQRKLARRARRACAATALYSDMRSRSSKAERSR